MVGSFSFSRRIAWLLLVALALQQFIFSAPVVKAAPLYTPGGVSDGLQLWFKANEGVTGTTNVSNWADFSDNNYDCTRSSPGSNGPELMIDEINFNPALTFNGSNEYCAIKDLNYQGINAIDNLAAYVVFKTDFSGNSYNRNWAFLDFDRSDYFDFYLRGDNGRLGASYRGAATRDNSGATPNLNNDRPQLGVFIYDGALTNDTILRINGAQDLASNRESNGSALGTNTKRYGFIGDGSEANAFDAGRNNIYYDGEIAEVIYYANDTQTQNEVDRIESYLALKYGIHKVGDYLDSGSLTIWNSSTMAGYLNDVAGIGRDDVSALNQLISKSQSGDGLITVSNASSQDDGDFLLWGNDDGAITQSTAAMPAALASRTTRVWRIQKTNDIGTVDVMFDVAALGLTGGVPGGYVLLKDTDTDFSDAPIISGDTLNSGKVTFQNVSFNDGDYFTLGVLPVTIGDKIWSDVNGNGVDDGGAEIGINGVTISLYSDDGVNPGVFELDDTFIGSTITSGSGQYDFIGLPAGDYWVDITDASNLLSSASKTGGNAEPELIHTIIGQDYNDADYGYQFPPPIVTSGNIAITAGSGTGGAYIVGDSITVTWDASAAGDIQAVSLTSVYADLSVFGGSNLTPMTDTSACGGTAGDDIYEACLNLGEEAIDVVDAHVSVTASNIGVTTGPVLNTDGLTIDLILPEFSASNLSIAVDNGVLGVAALNGNGIAPDEIRLNAALVSDDGDSITWDASGVFGSATQANNTSVTLTPGSVDDGSYAFAVTATDNAGNQITTDTATIDSSTISIDTVAPIFSATGSLAFAVDQTNNGLVNVGDTLNYTAGTATIPDTDTTSLDLSLLTGSSTATVTGNPHTVIAGSFAGSVSFVETLMDNAGNTVSALIPALNVYTVVDSTTGVIGGGGLSENNPLPTVGLITPPPTDIPGVVPELVPPPKPTETPVCRANPFARLLALGDTGSDVKRLQQFLNQQGFKLADIGPGAPGFETERFGTLTHNALIKYQDAHKEEILTPINLTQGTGFFGPSTKAFVDAQFACSLQKPVTPPEAATKTPIRFNNDLRLGDTGSDVKRLQQFLNQQGFTLADIGPGAPGFETERFGALTYNALIKYQNAHKEEILTPINLTQGTGFFGPSTRVYVNNIVAFEVK
ncbi:MAG: hypothetical protein H6759_01835 [Candidatus Nomurabacteria bacterium]|nr:MAG: hypothetical protein H6759_01835 [Candidatus Nomurabacteria bacterium]